jgi:hypothetical protein
MQAGWLAIAHKVNKCFAYLEVEFKIVDDASVRTVLYQIEPTMARQENNVFVRKPKGV